MWGAVTAVAELRPTARVDDGSCTRRHGSGCARCARACPVEAVVLEEGVARVEPGACVGCGLCVPVCPVGAIDGVGPAPAAVVAGAAGGTLRCEVARALGHRPVGEWVDVPCVAAVGRDVTAAAALAGGLTLLVGDCTQCPEPLRDGMERVCTETAATLAATDEEQGVVVRRETEPAATRGGLFRRGRQERSRVAAPKVSRRAMFGLPGAPEAETGPAPDPAASPRQLLLRARPDVALPILGAAEGCTACGGCVTICPTDALALARLGRARELVVDPRACVACGECVRVCPEQVLSLGAPERGTRPRVIAHVADARCERCGQVLGPGEPNPCHRCSTNASLADDVWRQLGP